MGRENVPTSPQRPPCLSPPPKSFTTPPPLNPFPSSGKSKSVKSAQSVVKNDARYSLTTCHSFLTPFLTPFFRVVGDGRSAPSGGWTAESRNALETGGSTRPSEAACVGGAHPVLRGSPKPRSAPRTARSDRPLLRDRSPVTHRLSFLFRTQEMDNPVNQSLPRH